MHSALFKHEKSSEIPHALIPVRALASLFPGLRRSAASEEHYLISRVLGRAAQPSTQPRRQQGELGRTISIIILTFGELCNNIYKLKKSILTS